MSVILFKTGAHAVNVRETALLAGGVGVIAMAVSLIQTCGSFVDMLHLGYAQPGYMWLYIATVVGQVVFVLPVLVLLLQIYRAGGMPMISRELRYLALALALVEIVNRVLPDIRLMISMPYRSVSIRAFNSSTVAGQIGHWLLQPWVRNLSWIALFTLVHAMVVLFLITLFQQNEETPSLREQQIISTTRIALVALVSAGLSVLVEVSARIGRVMQLARRQHQMAAGGWSGPGHPWYFWREAWFLVPTLCTFAMVWIIYRSFSQKMESLAEETLRNEDAQPEG